MKRVSTLIATVGIYTISTLGILVSAPKSASAFCVHNLTGDHIQGRDVSKPYGEIGSNKWHKTLSPDQRDCCPGDKEECRDVTVEIREERFTNIYTSIRNRKSCKVKPGNRGLIEVRYKDHEIVCNVL